MESISFADNFDRYFAIRIADTDTLKHHAYRIRHMVYAEELGWEPTHPEGIETDECDPYSFALLLEHKPSKAYAGTVRLVLPSPQKPVSELPFELHLADSLLTDEVDPAALARGSFGEISRLCVPAGFRRRQEESMAPYIVNEEATPFIATEEDRRNFPNIAIGLYMSVIAFVDILNHTQVFVVMEPRLQKRLGRLGLNFRQCGREVDYHGKRALFYMRRSDFSSGFNSEMLELYLMLKRQLQSQITLYPYAWKAGAA